MKAGINVWTWGFDRKAAFEQALKEVSDIGYRYVENIYTVGEAFPDPAEFDALLARYGVEFVCGYYHLSGDDAKDLARADAAVKFLAEHKTPTMNIQAAGRPQAGVGEAELAHTAAMVRQVAEKARDAGITPCLHPHYATIIERAPELAYMMEHVEPELLSLTLDTAHTVLGGMDPVATFEKYAARVGYVHMKDIGTVRDPALPWYAGFRELGRGAVDFPAIAAILKRAGFEGVLCVELDSPRICGYKSALISRQYLREELGL